MTGLPIWVVYDHPVDWPDWYVAREWVGMEPSASVILERDLDRLRAQLEAKGLVKLMRNEEDDPAILETWL